MKGYWVSTVEAFLRSTPDAVVNQLSARIIEFHSGDHERQLFAWREEIAILRSSLSEHLTDHPEAKRWGIIFEYPLLRLQRRLDVVILAGNIIAVIEFKVGAGTFSAIDKRQVEAYALGLRDFHETSHYAAIWPILCVTRAAPGTLTPIRLDVSDVATVNGAGLSGAFASLSDASFASGLGQINVIDWDAGAYRPIPTIVQAAQELFAGHSVSEIAAASEDSQNLGSTTEKIIAMIVRAKTRQEHLVIFVTGVPGSGKTLVGLNAVHDTRFSEQGQNPGAYLSGNTPLVKVLQEALAIDARKRNGLNADEARRRVGASVQTLMNFLREYLKADQEQPPADHVIIFDEAQRAWDAAYGKLKFDRSKSEAALFLEIMGRHPDWAVIIALVGGGQEINKGELGISEWGRALKLENLKPDAPNWKAIASAEVLDGGEATSWQNLFDDEVPEWVERVPELHLGSSIRSYGSAAAPKWVDATLSGDIGGAAEIAQSENEFPIYITRDLKIAKDWLTHKARGNYRCGLVASSSARRLRADGLGVSLGATQLDEVAHWFLRDRDDIRSSYALEVTANEYGCQGLELDFVGVCWDGDMIWDSRNHVWQPRRLSGATWQNVGKADAIAWAINKYRVLLTRARLGTVIWVPTGSAADSTRMPSVYDSIARSLEVAGARPLIA